jgi:hypothetical protein
MSSKRFFLFDPIFSKLKKKKYLFTFKNFSGLIKNNETNFKLSNFMIKRFFF